MVISGFVESLLVMRIITKLTDYHVVSLLIFWLLRLLRIRYSRWDILGYVTDSETQVLPSVSFCWLVGIGAN